MSRAARSASRSISTPPEARASSSAPGSLRWPRLSRNDRSARSEPSCVLALLAVPAAARAQQLPDLSLEELMRIDAGRVFGASERMQPVTEAPASVSFITAEDIARYGYRTLADILRGVRGMYVTDDRNYSYLGARGFAKPGDYNSRILLLVNGHRVNDNVFGQAEIGAEFGMDPAMFERVEIIRGPASALYGDSAFFAVVNVITRTGASLDGASIAVEGGNLDTARTQASFGRRLANGLDFALSGTYERSGGVERLYFPAFDTPGHQQRRGRRARRRTARAVLQPPQLQGSDVHRRVRRPAAARSHGLVRHRCSTSSDRPSRRPIGTRSSTPSTRARSAPRAWWLEPLTIGSPLTAPIPLPARRARRPADRLGRTSSAPGGASGRG